MSTLARRRENARTRGPRAVAVGLVLGVVGAAALVPASPVSASPVSASPVSTTQALSAFAGAAPEAAAPQPPAPLAPAPLAPAPLAATTAAVETPECSPSPPVRSLAAGSLPPAPYDLSRLAELADASGVTVAVVDSGVDPGHPQLRGVVAPGEDLLSPGGDARIDCVQPAGHGTPVASVIAARPRSGVAFAGLAPGARILPIRVSERVQEGVTASGAGDVSDLAAGILAAARSRPKPAVINLSISSATDTPQLRQAVQSALRADIVVVAAVGNHHDAGGDPTPYPAAYDGVVGVGAIGGDGMRWEASQVGPYVDVVAPGEGVVAAVPGGGYLAFDGTSFATPFVAATAALVRARYPDLDRAEVVRRLLATTDPAPGSRAEYGYGSLNPVRALTEIVRPATAAGTPAPAPAAVGGPATSPADPGRAPAVLAAAMLGLAALVIAALAAALPYGRRRGWRPGAARR